MMKPSSKTTYVLKALVDLTLHQGVGPVRLKTIAQRQQIPLRYLEQLFNQLRRQGLVTSERGPRGGYSLNLPPEQIQVSKIFESLEAEPPRMAAGPSKAEPDPTAALWKQVEKVVHNTLKATTLRHLADQAQTEEKTLKAGYTFQI